MATVLGLMWAKPIIPNSLVAVVAENPVARGETLLTKPTIKLTNACLHSQPLPMFITSAINVVNRQELRFNFSATGTLTTIGSNGLLSQSLLFILTKLVTPFRMFFIPSKSIKVCLLALLWGKPLASFSVCLACLFKILSIPLRVGFNFCSQGSHRLAFIATTTKPFSLMFFKRMTSSLFLLFHNYYFITI